MCFDDPVEATSRDERRRVEQWFRRRGFTSLLEDTAMHRSPATLARVLAAVFAATMVVLNPIGGPNVVGGFVIGSVLLLVTWVGLNLLAGRRPLTPPREAGPREKFAFVAVPTLAALLTPSVGFNDGELVLSAVQVSLLVAVGALLGQLLLLWAVTLLVRSGLVAVFPWLGRQVAVAFWSAGGALGRTIPLLLGVVALIYFTSEIWQTIGRLASWAYLGVLALFLVLTWVFIHSRHHLDLDALATFTDADELDTLLADTPLAGAAVHLPARTPLAQHHVKDLRLVATMSRVTVVSVISAAVFAFFMLLGVLAIDAAIIRVWVGGAPEVLWTLVTTRHRYDLTWEHLRVAGFLAVFSGFYFAVISRTDAALRSSLGDVAEDTVREACAARLVALARYPRGS